MRIINIARKILLGLIIWICSWVIPKKRNLIAFVPIHDPNGVFGNLHAVHRYMATNYPDIRCVWLSGGRGGAIKGCPQSLAFWWLACRARFILIDGIDLRFKVGRFYIIQLWHGIGFKNIGLMNKKRSGLDRLYTRLHFLKYCYVSAGSEEDQVRKRKAFGVDQVFVSGSPRNDLLLDSKARGEIADRTRKVLGLPQGVKLILYAPTFRESKTSEWRLSGAFLESIKECFSKTTLFLIKRHPNDPTPFEISSEFVRDITNSGLDVQHLLCVADLLITDYSGIVTDFVLQRKPIVFYLPDYADYKLNSRDFYYDLMTTLPGPFAFNESELRTQLIKFANSSLSLSGAYDEFIDRFHKYRDTDSSKRVATWIAEALAS